MIVFFRVDQVSCARRQLPERVTFDRNRIWWWRAADLDLEALGQPFTDERFP